jgi:hypothetical protein
MYYPLFYFALLLGFFPIFLLTVKAKSKNSLKYPIAPFLWLILLSGIYEYVGTSLFQLPSEYWFKLYSLLEYFTLSYFFYYLLEKKYKTYFLVFSILYLTLFSVIVFYWDSTITLKTDSYLSIIEIVFVYFFTIIWLKNIFSNVGEHNFIQTSDFYFISGIVLYLSGTFFLYLLGDSIFKDEKLFLEDFWIINIVFNINLRMFLILGVWKIPQK